MAFTNIPNGNLQVGAPLRSVDILALRDNIPAVMNGDTGAPKIKAAAFQGQSGAAPVFAARAWVNFNGTGTVAIRASGNVDSITDLGVGRYRVNFAIAMPDANYVTIIENNNSEPGNIFDRTSLIQDSGTYSTTAVDIISGLGNTTFADFSILNVTIFR